MLFRYLPPPGFLIIIIKTLQSTIDIRLLERYVLGNKGCI